MAVVRFVCWLLVVSVVLFMLLLWGVTRTTGVMGRFSPRL